MNQITYSIKGATDKITPDLDSYEIKPDLNYLIQILNKKVEMPLQVRQKIVDYFEQK